MWAILAVVLFAGVLVTGYACLAEASREYEIDESKFIHPIVSPEPQAAVRYPVPLSEEIQDYITDKALEHEISPTLVMAIIGVESDYNVDEIGDDGQSYGLMQIYAAEHIERCKRLGAERLLEPKQNIAVGIDYLAELFSYEKSLEWVLMAYNGGVSYANDMESAGAISEYVKRVLDTREIISEGIMTK